MAAARRSRLAMAPAISEEIKMEDSEASPVVVEVDTATSLAAAADTAASPEAAEAAVARAHGARAEDQAPGPRVAGPTAADLVLGKNSERHYCKLYKKQHCNT